MEDRFKELLSLVQEDSKWLGDAADHFEDLARRLSDPEKSKWGLLTAVYRERANIHRALVQKLRDGKRLTKPGIEGLYAEN